MPAHPRLSRCSTPLSMCLLAALALGCEPGGIGSDTPSPNGAATTEGPTADPKPKEDPAAQGDPQTAVAADPDAGSQTPPRAAAKAVEVSFDELNIQLQADVVFRPWMLDAYENIKELDGKRIRISGYMLADAKIRGITEFVLLKNTECKFGPGGQADHLINVTLAEGKDTFYRSEPVEVEGVFKINPFQGPDGNTWSIYDMTIDQIVPMRR